MFPSSILVPPTARRLAVLLATVVAALAGVAVAASPAEAAPEPRTASAAASAPGVRTNLVLTRRVRTMRQFLNYVLRNVHSFWSQEFAAAGLSRPGVRHRWTTTRAKLRTGCGRTRVLAAFYCPADDTIYISERFAARVWNGRVRGPGGRTAGDLGVATIVAHEYAHNVQWEVGIYEAHPEVRQSRPFELQADCMAGLWANNAYYQGILEAGDPEEAAATSAAVGDYALEDPDHHGTPAERRAAWQLGYDTGDFAQCAAFVPAA